MLEMPKREAASDDYEHTVARKPEQPTSYLGIYAYIHIDDPKHSHVENYKYVYNTPVKLYQE